MVTRILIVEDDPLLRNLMAAMLEQVEEAKIVGMVSSGLEVANAVTELQPDVMLLDLNLDGCHGLTALDQVQALQTPTRVLILTATGDENAAIEAARRGTHGFLHKLEALSALPKAIRALFNGEYWFSRRVLGAIIADYPALITKVRQLESPISLLSDREREVLVMISKGYTNKRIADELYMSVSTVKSHIRNLFQKLDLPSRTEAAVFAVREGLLSESE